MKEDSYYMNVCLGLAEKARMNGDVPIGCILVDKTNGKIICKAYNMKYKKKDSTLHAEIIALKKAFKKTKSIYLEKYVIYITLEPCIMCVGAIINSRIKTVVVGTMQNSKKKYELDYSNFDINIKNLDDLKCKMILSDFFKEKRRKKWNI